MPFIFGEMGVWVSFAIADVLATLVTGYYLKREIDRDLVAA